ncbi:MAG: transposase [Calothrix sp. C42_A2020_038]|nr:transposase [Calothrix sp. C42_A2020_038]
MCGNKQKKSLSQRVHHCSVCGFKMQRDILSAYLSRYVDPKEETLSIEEARNSYSGMEQSLLDGWQHGSNQSASTATSSKSPISGSNIGNGVERISSKPIARKESEPVRVDETCVASWNPPTSVVG